MRRRRTPSTCWRRTQTGCFRLRTPKLPLSVNGAGDAIAALFFAHYLRTGAIGEALSAAGSAIFGVLAKTAETGSREIQLVAAQDEIVTPSRVFEAKEDRMSGPPSVIHVDRLELSFAPKPWTYAIEQRGAIDEFFAALQRKVPAVWNGRVLVLHSQSLADGVFRGAYLETDYASFAAWRAWGRPPAGVHDCFGAAAIVSADGAVLLGVMGEHTAQAGRVYFPCGTPDRQRHRGRPGRSRFQCATRAQGGNGIGCGGIYRRTRLDGGIRRFAHHADQSAAERRGR